MARNIHVHEALVNLVKFSCTWIKVGLQYIDQTCMDGLFGVTNYMYHSQFDWKFFVDLCIHVLPRDLVLCKSQVKMQLLECVFIAQWKIRNHNKHGSNCETDVWEPDKTLQMTSYVQESSCSDRDMKCCIFFINWIKISELFYFNCHFIIRRIDM